MWYSFFEYPKPIRTIYIVKHFQIATIPLNSYVLLLVKRVSITMLVLIQSFFGTNTIHAQTGGTASDDTVAKEITSKDPVSFVGIKKSKTAVILDTFKENQEKLLFTNSPFTPEEERGLFESQGKIKNLEEFIQRIESSKDALKEQKKEVTSRKFTLQSLLRELSTNIENITGKISYSEESIRAKNREIADLLREMVELQNRIDANKETILNYLSYIYSKGDFVYGEDESIDLIRTLVFTEGNVSDVLANYHFMSIIEVTGQNFLEERRTMLKDYYVRTQQMKQEKAGIIELKRQLALQKKELEDQKEYRQNLLQKTRGQEALFNEYIFDRQEKQAKIEDRLTVAMQEYDDSFATVADRSGCRVSPSTGIIPISSGSIVSCAELNLSYHSEKKLREFALEEVPENPLAWPVDPHNISAYFHDADYFESVGSSHEGIDIPIEQGTEIVSPMPGYVYFLNEPTPNGY